VTLTAKEVAEITRLLEESSFDEMDLELDGLRLTLRRHGAGGISESPRSGEGGPADATAVRPAISVAPEGGAQDITAPLLGTFYRAPRPGAPPFIEVGSPVEEDSIIGIIEVMKLMNTVRAGTRGRVVEIRAQDGKLVEYGEILVRVSKATQA
jgi:acetyl-CoA carboxylase biotin carboxyl carrier protein